MERVRQLALFWNWLPAYRAVAETQHLPTAAKALHVTAPALSRSIRLLERQLDQKLFRRAGRNIVLTDAGKRFLDSVRDGMRVIHEGMEALSEIHREGDVLIASSGLITTYLIQALEDLRQSHAGLRPVVSSVPPRDTPELLLRSELDLALHDVEMDVPRLTTEFLGEASSSIYCGPGHPLYSRRKVTREMISEHEFVGPVDESVLPDRSWPPELPRKAALRVSHLYIGCDVCAQGGLLATLPDVVARAYSDGKVLHRLPVEVDAPTRLFAMHRPSLGITSRADVVLEALRRRIGG